MRKPKQKKQSTTVVLVQPSAPTASIAPAQAANSSRNNKRGSRGAKRRRKSTRPTDRTASEECARAAGDPAGAAMAAAIARIAPETTVEPEKTANLAERPRNLPGFKEPPWELQYHVEHIERQLQPLLSEPMLGIDVEWRPTFVAGKPRNKIALVQVSSRTRCVLVPVRHLDVSRLPTLGRLLGGSLPCLDPTALGEIKRSLMTPRSRAAHPTPPNRPLRSQTRRCGRWDAAWPRTPRSC